MRGYTKKLKLLRRYLLIRSGLQENLDPSFFIIGAQKSGTTSLFNYIEKYASNFASPLKKEIHYYDYMYYKGFNWYRSHYPLINKDSNLFITGEASPYYLFHPVTPARIKKDFPHARFIVLLRNPIDRAYSHFNFQKNNGIGPDEPLSFKEAIKEEDKRLKGETEKLRNSGRYRGKKHQYYSYLARGKYAEQLKRWYKYFNKEQFLIVQSERFYKNTEQQLNVIFSWLGLYRNSRNFSVEIMNASDYSSIDADTRNELRQYYKPSNEELFELIGKKFTWN